MLLLDAKCFWRGNQACATTAADPDGVAVGRGGAEPKRVTALCNVAVGGRHVQQVATGQARAGRPNFPSWALTQTFASYKRDHNCVQAAQLLPPAAISVACAHTTQTRTWPLNPALRRPSPNLSRLYLAPVFRAYSCWHAACCLYYCSCSFGEETRRQSITMRHAPTAKRPCPSGARRTAAMLPAVNAMLMGSSTRTAASSISNTRSCLAPAPLASGQRKAHENKQGRGWCEAGPRPARGHVGQVLPPGAAGACGNASPGHTTRPCLALETHGCVEGGACSSRHV